MTFTRLTWGVKASFRAYVEAAGGTISVSDGPTRDANGAFVFTALPGGDLAIPGDGPPTGALRFQGTVAFEAHGGMLRASLAELGAEAEQDRLVLTAAQAPGGTRRCIIARLGPGGVDSAWRNHPGCRDHPRRHVPDRRQLPARHAARPGAPGLKAPWHTPPTGLRSVRRALTG